MFKTSKDYTIYKVKLIDIKQEASSTFTYSFTKPTDLHWDEGAHTHLALDQFDESIGWWQKKDVRHLSIMSLESENIVSMTTRLPQLHSSFKEFLKASQVGDDFYLFKVGTRLKLARDEKPIIMLSAGVGIATLRPIVKAIEGNQTGITRVHHMNIDSSGEYLFEKEFESFDTNISTFTHEYVKTRQAFYEGLDKTLNHEDFKDSYVYIIGSDEFILTIRDILMKHNISDQQLVLDKKEDFYQSLTESVSK